MKCKQSERSWAVNLYEHQTGVNGNQRRVGMMEWNSGMDWTGMEQNGGKIEDLSVF